MPKLKVRHAWWRSAAALGVLALCIALSAPPAAAQTTFTVDVWTNKGGSGPNASGGSFGISDDLIVYFRASHDCIASITFASAGQAPEQAYEVPLDGGATLQMTPNVPKSALIGSWLVTVEACTNTSCVSDSVSFTVGTSGQAVLPTATVTITAQAATALDALKALKMAQGALAADLAYDADHNGSVTADDARLILSWAVE